MRRAAPVPPVTSSSKRRTEVSYEAVLARLVTARRFGVRLGLERTLRWFERGRQPERRTGTALDDAEIPATD